MVGVLRLKVMNLRQGSIIYRVTVVTVLDYESLVYSLRYRNAWFVGIGPGVNIVKAEVEIIAVAYLCIHEIDTVFPLGKVVFAVRPASSRIVIVIPASALEGTTCRRGE